MRRRQSRLAWLYSGGYLANVCFMLQTLPAEDRRPAATTLLFRLRRHRNLIDFLCKPLRSSDLTPATTQIHTEATVAKAVGVG